MAKKVEGSGIKTTIRYIGRGSVTKFGKWMNGVTRSIDEKDAKVLLGDFPARFKEVKGMVEKEEEKTPDEE